VLSEDSAVHRDNVLETLNGGNYMARPAWTLLHKLKPYKEYHRMPDMAAAEQIERTLINLPSSPKLVRSKTT